MYVNKVRLQRFKSYRLQIEHFLITIKVKQLRVYVEKNNI